MNEEDLKIGILNTIVLAISFSNIETSLRLFLLLVSIGYTCLKIYKLLKDKRNEV